MLRRVPIKIATGDSDLIQCPLWPISRTSREVRVVPIADDRACPDRFSYSNPTRKLCASVTEAALASEGCGNG